MDLNPRSGQGAVGSVRGPSCGISAAEDYVDYFIERFLEAAPHADLCVDDPLRHLPVGRAFAAAEHLIRLLERHREELAGRPGLFGLLAGRAWWLSGETQETLSRRGRSMLAARGGRGRMKQAREQGIDLQALAVAARKRKARERREAARRTPAS